MRIVLPAAAALLAVLLPAQEALFRKPPTAAKQGEGLAIAFEAAAKTDAEFAILNAQGKVVRHLAAGVLGGAKAPPEPLRAGLVQELVWDGKDDFGAPAAGGPFRVRVRAGMGVRFGRTLSDSPYYINTLRGLAGDADGNVYVFHQTFDKGPSTVQVFDAEGNYARTAFPYSADLPRERLGDLIHWDPQTNRAIPRNYNDIYPRFLPYEVKAREDIAMFPIVTEQGGILIHTANWIFRLDTDGSTGGRPLRYGFLFATGISPYDAAYDHIFTSASPGGARLFATGPYSKKDKDNRPFNALWPAGRIFEMALDDLAYMKPFADLPIPADGPKAQPPLAGLAADAQGRLWVCDRANGRIAVLDAQGRVTAALAVEHPFRVAVHPANDSVYVLTREDSTRTESGRKGPVTRHDHRYRLKRFESLQAKAPAAEADLGTHRSAEPFMVLSVKGGRTGIWLAAVSTEGGRLSRSDVTRYEEKDGAFEATVKLHERDPDQMGLHDTIAVDPFTEDVYINNDYSEMYRYHGLSGEGGSLRKVRGDFYATEIAVSRKGELYARTGAGYSGPFERLDRDLKPLALPSGSHQFTDYIYSRYGAGHAEKGVAAGPRGEAYVLNMYDWQRYAVYGLHPDGTFMDGKYLKGELQSYLKRNGNKPESAVIGPLPDACGGLRADSRGNIYVGMLMLPPDHAPPAFLARERSWRSLVGSIVKFSPEGGEWISTHPDLAKHGPKQLKTAIPEGAQGIRMENGHFLSGALAVYPEFAPFSGTAGTSELGRPPLGRENCACRSPRFDLDPYDRLYVPNAVTCSVRILDNAGNEILRFGDYGNYDSAGPQSRVPQPEIPLGWPVGVGVSEDHIYICDQVNRRVLRVDKTWKAEAVVDVK